jgi:hypothetical protein
MRTLSLNRSSPRSSWRRRSAGTTGSSLRTIAQYARLLDSCPQRLSFDLQPRARSVLVFAFDDYLGGGWARARSAKPALHSYRRTRDIRLLLYYSKRVEFGSRGGLLRSNIEILAIGSAGLSLG